MNTRVAGKVGRCGWIAAVVLFSMAGVAAGAPPVTGRLLARDQMARLGLQRAWFAQVQVDYGRSRVERAILSGNQLFVLTNAGTLQAINAATGETQWVAPFGNPDYPSLGPSANEFHVAIVNGTTLYVVKRENGLPAMTRKVGGAPGAAPAMSPEYCYVPMLNGRVEGYPILNEKLPTWNYMSQGRAMVAPLTTRHSVVWSTDRGHIYVGNGLAPGARFRLETESEIVASPSSRGPMLYVGTVHGEVIAVDEMTGSQPWRFAAGYPILRSPAAVGGRIYATSARPTLFAIDAATGLTQWAAPKITQFAAASNDRVYAMDSLGALVVLDAANGATLARMPTDGTSVALVNDQTDRLYLISSSGLVQCLHEIGITQPIQHQPLEEAPAATGTVPSGAPPTPPAKPAPGATPVPDDNPFGAPANRQPAGGAGDNPFGGFGAPAGGGAAPGGGAGQGGAVGDNPFGGGAAGGAGDSPIGGR